MTKHEEVEAIYRRRKYIEYNKFFFIKKLLY